MLYFFKSMLFLGLTVPGALGAYCNGKPDDGNESLHFTYMYECLKPFLCLGERTNEFPIFDEAPTFVKSVENAVLYEAGPSNARFRKFYFFLSLLQNNYFYVPYISNCSCVW
jgi:hypothetical protein